MTDTRKKIIQIIINRTVAGEIEKLKINDISEMVGISRQAFHRFYSDLKPYLDGSRSAIDLVIEDNDLKVALVHAHATIAKLRTEIEKIKIEHSKKLRNEIKNHTTTLQNNDLAIFDANEVRINAERQMLQIDEYKQMISHLKSQLAVAASNIQPSSLPQIKSKHLAYDLNLGSPSDTSPIDHEAFEDLKDRELDRIARRINSLQHKNICIILFIEKYICQFSEFVEKWPAPAENMLFCIVRCPLFSLPEIKAAFLAKIKTPHTYRIFIPTSESSANVLANRAFFFRNVPLEELRAADTADHLYLQKGIDQVTYFDIGTITQ
jgi:ACT domain-containing protein